MQPSPSLGWRDDVLARMRDTMARAQPGDFAVFDFDNTCIYHDIGDLYFQAMVNTMAFRTDLDTFWALFDPEDQPDALRALITPLRALSPEDRVADPRFEVYRRHMFSRYPARAARVDYPSGCALVVRLMVGLDPAKVQAHAAQVYQEALQQPLSRERWQDPLGGPSWSEPNHGTRVCVEIRDIMHELRERGVAVWVVSASATLWVQPYAALFGVPPERVLANGLTLGPDGLMTDTLTTPFTYRQGKLDIIRHVIDAERAPLMAFGDAMTDFEMLCAAQLPVVIDRGIAPLREQAEARGWPLQPRDALTFAQR